MSREKGYNSLENLSRKDRISDGKSGSIPRQRKYYAPHKLTVYTKSTDSTHQQKSLDM